VRREPLQTDARIDAAMFAAGDRALLALSADTLFEKPLNAKTGETVISRDRICLPANAGPQIASLGAASDQLLFAERRCSASGTFGNASRRVTPASLYGVDAYAIAFDRTTSTLVVTDPAGFLTIYRVPKAHVSS
jgi:hypothetical protein